MIKIITKRNKEFDEKYPRAWLSFNRSPQGFRDEREALDISEMFKFNLQTMLEICEEQIRRLEGEKVKDDCICGLGNDECLRQCAGGFNSAIDQQIQYWSSQRDEIKNLENHQP